MKRKIEIDIENKALERYPYDLVPDDTTMGFEKYDKNELLRKGYIQAMKDVFTREMMWEIFWAGRMVSNELLGKETSTEEVGDKILDKIELI